MISYNHIAVDSLPEFAVELMKALQGIKYVILTGNLGAGKTTLVKTIAEALGAGDMAASPSFSIHNTYEANKVCIIHTDLYRLESLVELENTGFFEMLEDADIVFIEWGDKFGLKEKLLPRAELSISGSGDERNYFLCIIR